uniref:Uncharacterized protein n=1 Tax=Acrobeloides nanus TaxID=290746 RepID=A0A914DB31_9BILA
MNSTVLCALLIFTIIAAVYGRKCAQGIGSGFSVDSQCMSGDYCYKVTGTDGKDVFRGCDTFSQCSSEGCSQLKRRFGPVTIDSGTVCCCESDNCNSATAIKTSLFFIFGTVILAAIFGTRA